MSDWSDVVSRLMATLPFSGELPALWKTQLSEAIEARLEDYALVGREEFQAHVRQLERTEEKLAQLQATLSDLQSKDSTCKS